MNCDHDEMDPDELIVHMFRQHTGIVVGGALVYCALLAAWYIALSAPGR